MYVPPAAMDLAMFGQEPTTGQRIARGLGWGFVFGQWWTLWRVVSFFLWNGVQLSQELSRANLPIPAPVVVIIGILAAALFHGFVGSLAGLIIGAINADEKVGAIVCIVFGFLLLGLQMLGGGSPLLIVNVFFWFITGRFIGASIAAKVQARVGV
jgi:hypothetical protein